MATKPQAPQSYQELIEELDGTLATLKRIRPSLVNAMHPSPVLKVGRRQATAWIDEFVAELTDMRGRVAESSKFAEAIQELERAVADQGSKTPAKSAGNGKAAGNGNGKGSGARKRQAPAEPEPEKAAA